MKYLLDVNALMAWSHPTVAEHGRFHAWAKAAGFDALATCAHVELGFIRVTMQTLHLSLADAHRALAEMKKHTGGFIATAPSPALAPWARTAAKTSDAYLVQLAESAGLKLATFDTGIPGAVQI